MELRVPEIFQYLTDHGAICQSLHTPRSIAEILFYDAFLALWALCQNRAKLSG